MTEDGPRVIDFESASLDRTPSNVTSTVQSLFMKHRFAQVLGRVYPMPDRDKLLDALKRYKREPVESNYLLFFRCAISSFTGFFVYYLPGFRVRFCI